MFAMSEGMRLIIGLIIVAFTWTFAIAGVSGEPSRVISAEDVLSKIKMGLPVEYDQVTIKGDLILNQTGLSNEHIDRTPFEINLGLSKNETVVNSSISINDSVILGRAGLSNSIFKKSVSFENTNFRDSADFKGTQFDQLANFKGAQFSGFVDFRDARFKGSAELEGARFNGSVDFAGAEFSRDRPLSGGFRFNETSEFLNSKLGEFSNFLRSKIKETTDIVRIQLILFVDFSRSGYDGTVSFVEYQSTAFINVIGPEYHKTAAFLKSQLIGFADLVRSEYLMTAGFIKPYFGELANFVGSKLDETARLGTLMIYNPGVMLKSLSVCSAIVVFVFAFFWRAIRPWTSKKSEAENSSSLGEFHKGPSHSVILNEFLMLLSAIRFSIIVFISGTKIFIDTPSTPEMPGRARYVAASTFVLERMIGALISILFFVAISRL